MIQGKGAMMQSGMLFRASEPGSLVEKGSGSRIRVGRGPRGHCHGREEGPGGLEPQAALTAAPEGAWGATHLQLETSYGNSIMSGPGQGWPHLAEMPAAFS